MKVCIPTNEGTGLADTLCGHFGSAPWFTLCDSESGEVTVLRNTNAHHSHGTCHPLSQLDGQRFDALVCLGMGRRALDMLNAQGIKVYRPGAATVGEVLAEIRAGSLRELDAAHACGGHGQGHGPHTHDA